MKISYQTVKNMLYKARLKMNVTDRVNMVLFALENGWLPYAPTK